MAFKYEEVVNYIEMKIKEDLKGRRPLPSVRELAEKFQCTRDTALRAYRELMLNNRAYAVPNKGYFVVTDSSPVSLEKKLIDMATAAPDSRVLPYREFQSCLNQAVERYKRSLFTYEATQGLPGLRQIVREWLAGEQIYCDDEQLFITAGTQQALQLLSLISFPADKDLFVVEQPTYAGMLGVLRMQNICVAGVTRTAQGLEMDKLEEYFSSRRVRYFYTCPRFQHPLGTSLDRQERKALVRLAKRYDVYIIEDDYLGDLAGRRFESSLYYEDMGERVVYLRSFSKTLLPGLRLGAAVLPKKLAQKFADAKHWADLGASVLSQGALEIYMRCGMHQEHRRKIRRFYAEKCRFLRRLTQEKFDDKAVWHVPENGFFACVEVKEEGNMRGVVEFLRSTSLRIKEPDSAYLPNYHDKQLLLSICFSTLGTAELTAGVQLLKAGIFHLQE